MKKNIKFYVCFFISMIAIGINSCKKDTKANRESKIPTTSNRVTPDDINQWFAKVPMVKPADLLIGQATQATINAQQVVRIPVANNAALYFIKQNDSLKVYAYRWIYSGQAGEKYTGKIDVYDFQSQNLNRLVYSNQNLTQTMSLVSHNEVNSNSPQKEETVQNVFIAIWCWVTGGSYIPGAVGGCYYPPDDTSGDDGGDDGGSSGGDGSGGYTFVYGSSGGTPIAAGSTTGGGAAWGPPPCPPNTQIIADNTNKTVDVAAPPSSPITGTSGCPVAPAGQWVQYQIPAPPAPALLVEDPTDVDWTTDKDNITLTDPDPTIPAQYQQTSPWPTVPNIIPFNKFVPIYKLPNGKFQNCLVLSKQQIAFLGYTCSGYLPGTQTFVTYTPSGANPTVTKEAITYIISALSKGIPVIAGVDAYPGSPNFDGITDHYIVIDGMGTNPDGTKYFHFVDNSTNNPSTGDYYDNKLYYNPTTGVISGKCNTTYTSHPGGHDYIITQVRKSVPNGN